MDSQLLRWPSQEEREAEDPYFAGNRQFVDLGDLDWSDAEGALARDRALATRVRLGEMSEDDISDEFVSDIENPLSELDVGVAGAVAAIAALGAFPAASCNGGAFGNFHSYQHPLVAFYCRPIHLQIIIACAEHTNVGVINSPIDDGSVILYALEIDDLMAFAGDLIRNAKLSAVEAR